MALALTVVGGLTGAPVHAESPTRHVETLYFASGSAPATAAASLSASAQSPRPCADGAYQLNGGKWRSAYQWSFRIGSTPADLNRAAAERAIRKGIDNIVTANNDCGRADRVSARAKYLGTTSRKAGCNVADGHNVVAFRELAAGTAARACWWVSGGRIVEADIQLNSRVAWTTSLSGCRDRTMLEAVMTHEAGHAFGLGHVGERRHGRLTMSTYIDGACQNNESTLGLGDMRALERLYP